MDFPQGGNLNFQHSTRLSKEMSLPVCPTEAMLPAIATEAMLSFPFERTRATKPESNFASWHFVKKEIPSEQPKNLRF
jgi:hypothetical protein